MEQPALYGLRQTQSNVSIVREPDSNNNHCEFVASLSYDGKSIGEQRNIGRRIVASINAFQGWSDGYVGAFAEIAPKILNVMKDINEISNKISQLEIEIGDLLVTEGAYSGQNEDIVEQITEKSLALKNLRIRMATRREKVVEFIAKNLG